MIPKSMNLQSLLNNSSFHCLFNQTPQLINSVHFETHSFPFVLGLSKDETVKQLMTNFGYLTSSLLNTNSLT
jgi:hypothetical protein